MRVSRWLIGIAAVAALAAGGAAAGCSSSSSPASTPDASNGEDAGCFVDANFSAFAASDAAAAGCAACVQANCMAGIKACESSCICTNLFSCLADAGIAATGLGSADLSTGIATCVPGGLSTAGPVVNDPGVTGVVTCFTMTCADACAVVLEAGVPEPDAGTPLADGGTTASDAGTTTPDAGDGG